MPVVWGSQGARKITLFVCFLCFIFCFFVALGWAGAAWGQSCVEDAGCLVAGRPQATGRCEASQCVYEVERFVQPAGAGGEVDDIAGLQAVLDAARPGDTVRFGVQCEGGRCEPMRYVVGGRGHDLVGRHGVRYDGQGSTLRLQARPAEVPWEAWRWRRVLTLGPERSEAPTRIERLHLDGSAARQGAGEEPSRQANLVVSASAGPGGEPQAVELDQVWLSESTASGLVVQDGVSVRIVGTGLWPSRTWGNATGIEVSAGQGRVELDGWSSGRRGEGGELAPDRVGLRLETSGVARQVTLVVRDSTVERPVEAAVLYSPGGWSKEPYHLQLDGLKVIEGLVQLSLYRTAYVSITRSELGLASSSGPALRIDRHCSDVLVRRTDVRGYVELGSVEPSCDRLESRLGLDAVHFRGVGWLEGGRRYAIRGDEAACPTRSRRAMTLGGRTTFGPGYDAMTAWRGGRVEVEVRTTRDWGEQHGASPAVQLYGGEGCEGQVRSELRWRPRSRRERASSWSLDHRSAREVASCWVEGEGWRCE